jgi:high affinity Mn2+ porin
LIKDLDFQTQLVQAGYPSGEAYKVGASNPYGRLPRAFIRQTFNLGGESLTLADGPNQIEKKITANNVTLTVGKFSVVDVFDTNMYAHDPRTDFLNWSILEGGAFDYAADAWGYTEGASSGMDTGLVDLAFRIFCTIHSTKQYAY